MSSPSGTKSILLRAHDAVNRRGRLALTERDDLREQQEWLERERKDVEMRIKRLVDAIDTGGDAVSLVAKVRELEARRSAIAGEVASLQPVPRLAPPIVATRLAEWRRLLRQSTTQSRAVLQRVMGGRLTFTPRADGQGYDFTGPTRFDSCSRASSSSGPTSSERETAVAWSTLRPEDTFDGD